MITGKIISMCDALALNGELVVREGPNVLFGPLTINSIETDFTIDDLVEYSNKDLIFEIFEDGSPEPIYSNTFYFPSTPAGDPVNYEDLFFYIRHSLFTCEGPEVFCGFYIVQYPCSTQVCVYNTTNSNNDHIYYKFDDVVKVGENACHIFNTYGSFIITQKINDNESFPGCCGQSEYSSISCTSEQTVIIDRYLPEVSILKSISDDCCEGCGCYDLNTAIEFIPDIHLKDNDCCSETVDPDEPVDCSAINNFIKIDNVFLPEQEFSYLNNNSYTASVSNLRVNRRNTAIVPIRFVLNQNIYCLCPCNPNNNTAFSGITYTLSRNEVTYSGSGVFLSNESINNGTTGLQLSNFVSIEQGCDPLQIISFENKIVTLDYDLFINLDQSTTSEVTIPFSGFYYKSPNCSEGNSIPFNFDMVLNVNVQIPSPGTGTVTITVSPTIPALYNL